MKDETLCRKEEVCESQIEIRNCRNCPYSTPNGCNCPHKKVMIDMIVFGVDHIKLDGKQIINL